MLNKIVYVSVTAKVNLRKCFDTTTVSIKHRCHLFPFLNKSILQISKQNKITKDVDAILKPTSKQGWYGMHTSIKKVYKDKKRRETRAVYQLIKSLCVFW